MPRRSPKDEDGSNASPNSSFGSAGHEERCRFFVYILQSQRWTDRHYTGFTVNVEQRLADHNNGCCDYTRPFIPWRLKTYVAFADESSARSFERYLKSGSGRAFARKRL